MKRAIRRKLAKKQDKASRPLKPQTCVLWIPAANGFLSWFMRKEFQVVGCSNLAVHYGDEEASRMAVVFRQATGLVASVRAYVPHPHNTLSEATA